LKYLHRRLGGTEPLRFEDPLADAGWDLDLHNGGHALGPGDCRPALV